MKNTFKKFLILTSAFALVGCGPKEENDGKLKVYASCYPVYDFLKQIGGEKIHAYMLPAPGLEPHEYEPTARDLTSLLGADAFFANGLGMEKWLNKLDGDMASKDAENIKKKTTYLGDKLGDLKMSVDGVVDPHAWLSTICADKYGKFIYEKLSELDKENAETYKVNYEAMNKKLEALTLDITEGVKDIENKKLVVSHAAFGYFADQFGFEQIYLSGLASEEVTVRDVERVINEIKTNNIKTVYAEELDGSDALDRIKEETGVTIKELSPIETLTKEDMDKGEDYYSIMRQNLATLKEGDLK
ncbi:MAG: zinc ABC transporter substrate-binding protein [Bacilli bacterium]|nr:zinc ABC transporter substrate-binding protein [Bacilli bacterium]